MAKTVGVPPQVANFKISPSGAVFDSATNRLPELSKARPRGFVRPVAQVVSPPLGVNFRIVSLPGAQRSGAKQSVETNKLPLLSKARPSGYAPVAKALGPTKTLRAPFEANL